ncbi:hypothetical protein D3C80_1817070 [compost metagenome]
MEPIKISVIYGHDWEAIYAGLDLVVDGHHVSSRELVEAMKKYDTLHVVFYDMSVKGYEWLEELGSFPMSIDLIPQYYLIES